ncbi:unnamed protein product [Musa textilis]
MNLWCFKAENLFYQVMECVLYWCLDRKFSVNDLVNYLISISWDTLSARRYDLVKFSILDQCPCVLSFLWFFFFFICFFNRRISVTFAKMSNYLKKVPQFVCYNREDLCLKSNISYPTRIKWLITMNQEV